MKILLLDIETAPSIAHVWGLWNENIPLDRLVNPGYILCWAAKWVGEKEVYLDSLNRSSQLKMLKGIHKLMDQADAIVHYNGDKFDIPTLNREFLKVGIPRPAPVNQLDLYKVVKKNFKFQSNKLEHVVKELGIGSKASHGGYKTWVGCMNGDQKSWDSMEKYNKQDTILLEKLYERLKPWIKGHGNYGLYENQGLVCPNCSGRNIVKRGYSYTAAAKYQRYRCQGCGNWFRSGRSIAPGPDEKYINI